MSIARLARTILFGLVIVSMVFVTAPAAEAQGLRRDANREVAFLSQLNAQRAAHGLSPLHLSASMSNSAGSWTASMVDGSFLAHSSNLSGGVGLGWTRVGENVGRGRSTSLLTNAFMASPTHARNVLDARFTHVGIAVIVHPNGRVYTTHRFAAMPGAKTVVTRAPVAPTPAPAPAAQGPQAFVQQATQPAALHPPQSAPNSLDQQRATEQAARMKLMASVFGAAG